MDRSVEDPDSFSSILPLPYRVAIIIVLGVWAWGVNLQYLSLIRIDVPALIHYPSSTSASHTPYHHSTYLFATLLTIPLCVFLILFWVLQWALFPNTYLVFLLLAFVLPSRFAQSGRTRFLKILRRVGTGGLAETHDGKFGDILMADVLTSYAKVLGDIFVVVCMIVSRKPSTARPDRSCGGWFFVPVMISIPSLIRLGQCLIEYFRVRKTVKVGMSTVGGWGGQHLANALKYSSAFPVIVLSAMQSALHSASKQDPTATLLGMSEISLNRLWVFAVFFNSFFSFYWDVMKDWDLSLLSLYHHNRTAPIDPNSRRPEYPYGLRRHRYFHSASIYYIVIVVDLLLRCTWSFKLSPHLHHANDMDGDIDLEGSVFILELLEVFRRWIWIFFRVETEWVRNNNKAPVQDDVLLGEYTGKYDDD